MIDLIKENDTISHNNTEECNETNHSRKGEWLSKYRETNKYSNEGKRDCHKDQC